MRRLRVGINLLALRPAVMGGAGEYVRVLLAHLAARGDADYVVVAPSRDDGIVPASMRPARAPRGAAVGTGRRGSVAGVWSILGPVGRLAEPVRAWHRAGVARRLRALIARERLDVWFCPLTNLQPRAPGVPGVITVLDLQHEHFPGFFDRAELAHRRAFYPTSCRAADHVIAISGFVRDDVVTRYGVAPDRVSVVWLAPAEDLDWAGARARVSDVRARHRLPARYALYPANAWPHKNHARLLEALARHRSHAARPLGLVLTGQGAEIGHRMAEAVARHGLRDAVRLLGYVPRQDLPALYAGAACLVLPSLFEGFALPLVEAMRAGCPIAAAAGTSIPEVAGDAALLFDPLDAAAIASALDRIGGDDALAAELTRRGTLRAAGFSASAMASRTLAALEQAVGAARVCGGGRMAPEGR